MWQRKLSSNYLPSFFPPFFWKGFSNVVYVHFPRLTCEINHENPQVENESGKHSICQVRLIFWAREKRRRNKKKPSGLKPCEGQTDECGQIKRRTLKEVQFSQVWVSAAFWQIKVKLKKKNLKNLKLEVFPVSTKVLFPVEERHKGNAHC